MSWGVPDSSTGVLPHIEASGRRVVTAEVWTITVVTVMAVLTVDAHVALIEPGHIVAGTRAEVVFDLPSWYRGSWHWAKKCLTLSPRSSYTEIHMVWRGHALGYTICPQPSHLVDVALLLGQVELELAGILHAVTVPVIEIVTSSQDEAVSPAGEPAAGRCGLRLGCRPHRVVAGHGGLGVLAEAELPRVALVVPAVLAGVVALVLAVWQCLVVSGQKKCQQNFHSSTDILFFIMLFDKKKVYYWKTSSK